MLTPLPSTGLLIDPTWLCYTDEIAMASFVEAFLIALLFKALCFIGFITGTLSALFKAPGSTLP